MDGDPLVRRLGVGLLVVATLVATGAAPTLGAAASDVRASLTLSVVALAWTWWAPAGPLGWTGRSLLAFVLCWLNPLYAIFAFVGFLDVFETFTGWRRWAGLALVAVTQAGAQSGGLPTRETWQAVAFVALIGVNLGVAGAFGSIAERTDERAGELERLNVELQRALDDNAALQAELVARARESGVSEERQRLAREIHDTIAQSLAGIVTQLEASVGGERQERALALARSALADARRSVLDLAPPDLDGATLPAALEALVGRWADGSPRVGTDVVLDGDAIPLHPEVEATVLRVAQESLTNVGKHADATRVGVTLSYDGDEVVLDVRDDGAGFDPTGPVREGGFGLRGMRQRAERLAGALSVESRPGGGTAISVRLPALMREAA